MWGSLNSFSDFFCLKNKVSIYFGQQSEEDWFTFTRHALLTEHIKYRPCNPLLFPQAAVLYVQHQFNRPLLLISSSCLTTYFFHGTEKINKHKFKKKINKIKVWISRDVNGVGWGGVAYPISHLVRNFCLYFLFYFSINLVGWG